MKNRIIRISTPNGSLKGADIIFLRQEMRKNRIFTDEVTEKRDNPIPMDMENLIKDLRPHLLGVYNILNHRQTEGEQKSLILETEVKDVEFTHDSFILKGEMMVFGDKRVPLKTPKIQESDEYDGYKEVMDIIAKLIIEAEGYLSGMKVVDDREMMLRWIEAKKDKDMTKESFEALTEDEQKEYMSKHLKMGIDVAELEEEEDNEDEVAIVLDEPVAVAEVKDKKSKKKKDQVQLENVISDAVNEGMVNLSEPETPAF